jgi:hypothetical protein
MTLYLPPNQNEIVSYVSKFSLSCIWIATPGTADQPCMIGGAVDLAAALRAISRKIELRQQSSANARRMVGESVSDASAVAAACRDSSAWTGCSGRIDAIGRPPRNFILQRRSF